MIKKILKEFNSNCEIIAGSIRNQGDVLESISSGADIVTTSLEVLESLKKAKEFTEIAFIDFIKHKHNTHQDSISPHKINFTDTKEVATRLSHDAPVFVPTATPDTGLQEPLYSQPLYSVHLSRLS